MNSNLHDDEFPTSIGDKSFFRRFIVGGILGVIFTLLLYAVLFAVGVLTIYFFLAALGLVPVFDVVPLVPFI